MSSLYVQCVSKRSGVYLIGLWMSIHVLTYYSILKIAAWEKKKNFARFFRAWQTTTTTSSLLRIFSQFESNLPLSFKALMVKVWNFARFFLGNKMNKENKNIIAETENFSQHLNVICLDQHTYSSHLQGCARLPKYTNST